MGWRVVALFFSGAAALVYQVIWTREITLLMGSTVAAVTTVLATFMAGLGLGSALSARFVDRLAPRALARFYAALEGGIALFAVGFAPLVSVSTPLFAALYRSSLDSPGLLGLSRFTVSALLLLVPTTLMGATLPALTALAGRGTRKIGRVAGLLYAANTVGAMVGSLATGVVLLPVFGVARSNLLAVALNLLAAGIIGLSPSGEPGNVEEAKDGARKAKKLDRGAVESLAPAFVLGVIALSGLGALAHEVAWTRALVLLIGPTPYGFAFILTSVIAGIALGSAAVARWADGTTRPASLLAALEWGAALASLVVIRILGALPIPVGRAVLENADDISKLMAVEFFWVFGLLLVPSFLFGAAFPVAVRLLSESSAHPPLGVGRERPIQEVSAAREPGRVVGRVYAWNTVGAIAGALLGGFIALSRLGLEGTLYAAAGVHALAGALAIGRSVWTFPRLVLAASSLVGVAGAALLLPRWDVELLSGGVYKYASYARPGELLEVLRRGELVYYKEGRTATVSVKQIGDKLSLAIDGKVDATNAGDMLTQRLLAHVPLLLHGNAKEVCVIGLGSGVTAGSALAHPIARLDAVEISREVVEAARFFKEANRNALSSPKIRVIVGDGRNHLRLTDLRYDVIISEPSNPWMAGVSALFTRDFFELARTRLRPGGLFCQWAHIYNMATEDLKTLVGGFTDAFPTAALFLINEGDVLLIGGESLPAPDAAALAARMSAGDVPDDLAGVEVRNPYTFASLYAVSTPALSDWARAAVRHTDDTPVLELRAPRFIHANTSRQNIAAIREAARGDHAPEPFASLRSHASAEELASRARMLEKSESSDLAMEAYHETLIRDPRLLAAAEGLVRTAIAARRTTEAEEALLRQAEGVAPVEAGIALGLLYNNLGRPQDALARLARAVQLEPTNVRALLLAAEIQGDGGAVDAMEALAKQALVAKPGNTEALAYLAEASLRRENLEEALARAEAVLERDPVETRALEVAAIVRAQTGDRKRAREAFELLVEVEPEAWVHLNNFALFELRGNDFAAAARLFERAVDVNPQNVEGYRGLLEAARVLGDRERIERAQAMLLTLGVSSS